MNIEKHVLLCGLSLFYFFSFSFTSLADTTTSQAGISFTEKIEEAEKEKNTFQQNKELPNTESSRTSSYLPQTGEHEKKDLFPIGLILLAAPLIITKRRNEMRRKKNEIKNNGTSKFSWE